MYERDAEIAGAFADRHRPGRRIYVLRRPRMPSVIVETHHALDVREVTRWRENRTMDAFARAIAAAIVGIEGGGAPPVAASP